VTDDRGLDAEKLAALERWGTGLQSDPRPEVAASGRAILMLIEEIERLHVLVWERRLYPQDAADRAGPESGKPELGATLRQRLRLRRQARAEEPTAAVLHSPSTPPEDLAPGP
jgi:hypothetical protein